MDGSETDLGSREGNITRRTLLLAGLASLFKIFLLGFRDSLTKAQGQKYKVFLASVLVNCTGNKLLLNTEYISCHDMSTDPDRYIYANTTGGVFSQIFLPSTNEILQIKISDPFPISYLGAEIPNLDPNSPFFDQKLIANSVSRVSIDRYQTPNIGGNYIRESFWFARNSSPIENGVNQEMLYEDGFVYNLIARDQDAIKHGIPEESNYLIELFANHYAQIQ